MYIVKRSYTINLMSKKNLVVLTGAGISAESGLKTFRDSDGLWNGYNVEDVATPRAWRKDMQLVLNFYNERRKDVAKAQPNAAHIVIAEMEKDFNVHIITQNIDDLHERAGSTNVLHLHGEIFKMRSCEDENLVYSVKDDILLGHCADDGCQLRPHIVWFEEPVPAIEQAMAIATDANIFVIVGTSLAVYPAAGLVHYAAPLIPKFIVDKNVPSTGHIRNITVIEMPATKGIEVLQQHLKKLVV